MTTTTRALPAAAVSDRLAAILVAAFFGLGLVYASGFATPTVLHNAAHDMRHATGFPCH